MLMNCGKARALTSKGHIKKLKINKNKIQISLKAFLNIYHSTAVIIISKCIVITSKCIVFTHVILMLKCLSPIKARSSANQTEF